MTPEVARAMYRRMITADGETITLRRINPGGAPPTEKTVLARVTGYSPEELVAGIDQGDRKVIILAEDVRGFPTPIKSGSTDRVVVRGAQLMIAAVDASTRRVGGTLIAYEIRATGAADSVDDSADLMTLGTDALALGSDELTLP